jgi:hypothetical protein
MFERFAVSTANDAPQQSALQRRILTVLSVGKIASDCMPCAVHIAGFFDIIMDRRHLTPVQRSRAGAHGRRRTRSIGASDDKPETPSLHDQPPNFVSPKQRRRSSDEDPNHSRNPSCVFAKDMCVRKSGGYRKLNPPYDFVVEI